VTSLDFQTSAKHTLGTMMKTDVPAPGHVQKAASLVLYGGKDTESSALKCFIQLAPSSQALLAKLR
jgi:hypothetical protein